MTNPSKSSNSSLLTDVQRAALERYVNDPSGPAVYSEVCTQMRLVGCYSFSRDFVVWLLASDDRVRAMAPVVKVTQAEYNAVDAAVGATEYFGHFSHPFVIQGDALRGLLARMAVLP